jgi:Fibronectin type III domain
MSLSSLNSVHKNVVKKGLAKLAAPTGLTYSSPTESSVVFSYTAPAGTVTNYSIYYSTSSGYTGSLYTTTTSTSVTISGLTSANYYWLYVTANNAAGSSPYSNSYNVQTAPKPPTGVSGSGTTNSVTLYWTAPTGGGNVGISGYYVYFNNTYHGMAASTATSYTVSGLSSSTSYPMSIQTVAGNASTMVGPINVSTTAPPPSPPSGSVSLNTSGTFTIYMNSQADATQYGYDLWTPTGTKLYGSGWAAAPWRHTISVGALPSASNYYVVMYASGVGPYSQSFYYINI